LRGEGGGISAMRLFLRFMGFLFTAGTIVFLVGVAAVAGLLWHYS
jgi:penicillin-binding protein 1A